jgi:hypothetical protein
MTQSQKLTKIGNLLNRIAKYLARYELILDRKSILILKSVKSFLDTVPAKEKQETLINTCIYYDMRYDPTQLGLRSFYELEGYLEHLINED